MAMPDTLTLNYPQCLAQDFPAELPAAISAVECVDSRSRGRSFDALVERSPGLEGNDWSNYLRCSIARMTHAAHAVRRFAPRGAHILDYGAYFGNFALMFRELGYPVDVVDGYSEYHPSLGHLMPLFSERGLRILD